jgi:hypothetical protein
LPVTLIAAESTVGLQTASVVVAIMLTLSGVLLRWRLPAYEMDAEDAVKDGKLTGHQLERRVRWVRDGARMLTLAGLVLLVASLMVVAD